MQVPSEIKALVERCWHRDYEVCVCVCVCVYVYACVRVCACVWGCGGGVGVFMYICVVFYACMCAYILVFPSFLRLLFFLQPKIEGCDSARALSHGLQKWHSQHTHGVHGMHTAHRNGTHTDMAYRNSIHSIHTEYTAYTHGTQKPHSHRHGLQKLPHIHCTCTSIFHTYVACRNTHMHTDA